MSDSNSLENSIVGSIVVIGISRDHAEIWSLEERQSRPLAVVVRHDAQAEHRHVKTGQHGHGHESEEGFSRYFADLASLVSEAGEIMIAGHGTGRSNMMEEFADWLSRKRVSTFAKVSELRYVDLPHTTGRELAALARKWKKQQQISGASLDATG